MSNEATRKVGEKNGKGDVPTCLFLQKVGSWPKQLFFVPCFFFRILKVSFFTISTTHFAPVPWPSKIQCFRFQAFFRGSIFEVGTREENQLVTFSVKSHGSMDFLWGGFFFKQNVDGRLKKENWNNQPMRCHFLMPTFFGIKFISTWAPCFMERKNLTYDAKGAWNIYSLIGAKASSMQVVSSDSI